MAYEWQFDPVTQRWVRGEPDQSYVYTTTDGSPVTITLPEHDPSRQFTFSVTRPAEPKEGPMANTVVKLVVRYTNDSTEEFAASKHFASDGLITLQDSKGATVATLNQDQVRSITPLNELAAPEVTTGAHTYLVHTQKGEVTVQADTYSVHSHNDEAVFYTFTTALPSGATRQEASFPASAVSKVLRLDGVPAQREDSRV